MEVLGTTAIPLFYQSGYLLLTARDHDYPWVAVPSSVMGVLGNDTDCTIGISVLKPHVNNGLILSCNSGRQLLLKIHVEQEGKIPNAYHDCPLPLPRFVNLSLLPNHPEDGIRKNLYIESEVESNHWGLFPGCILVIFLRLPWPIHQYRPR